MNSPVPLGRLLLALVMGSFFAPNIPADDNAPQPLVLNLNNTGHVFRGFGVQVWAGDLSVEPVLRDLQVALVRMSVDPFPKEPPDVSGWTDADYDKWAAGKSPGGWLKSWELLKKYHIRVIANVFQVPDKWKMGAPKHRVLDPRYHLVFSRFVAAGLKRLCDRGVELYALEAFNEPDGDWNCYVPPEGYNAVVKLLRRELDRRGLQAVALVGPGLAHIDTGGHERWLEALDADAVRSLGAWSIHGYLWDAAHAGALDAARVAYERGFGPALAAKDPAHAKPVIITEFAPLAAFKQVQDAIQQPPFAALAVQHALSFFNCGAGMVSYWEAADMYWAPEHHHGLIRLDKSPRPVYFALQNVFAHWPPGARVVTAPPQPADDVYAAAVFEERTQTLVLSLVNCTTTARDKCVRLVANRDLAMVSAQAFEDGRLLDKVLALENGDTLRARLQPSSVLTCDLRVTQRPSHRD